MFLFESAKIVNNYECWIMNDKINKPLSAINHFSLFTHIPSCEYSLAILFIFHFSLFIFHLLGGWTLLHPFFLDIATRKLYLCIVIRTKYKSFINHFSFFINHYSLFIFHFPPTYPAVSTRWLYYSFFIFHFYERSCFRPPLGNCAG